MSIAILAKPGAKQSRITGTKEQLRLFVLTGDSGIDDEGVGVQINAPATEGKANEELLDFMSEVHNV